jgi:hypothetical protein
MAARVLRPVLLAGAILLAHTGRPVSVVACPPSTVHTLTDEVSDARMVLVGTLDGAQLDPNAADQDTTDLRIEAVIKGLEALGNQGMIRLSRYVPITDPTTKFLVFFDVHKGTTEAYRGAPLKAGSDMVKYLQRALAVKDKPIGDKLRFFFDYLDNPDLEISTDAYLEFSRVSYTDYREMARHLPAQRIAKWLQDPDTPCYRVGLYAMLLGHSGKEADAALLRKLLDETRWQPNGPRMSDVLVGYTLLKPSDGWAYLERILKDPTRDFYARYEALRAVRFFWGSQPLVIDREKLLKATCLLVDQSDIADLAIEDLRKRGRWELAPRMFCLYKQRSHDVPVVRRAILRYALSCPCPEAAAFLDGARAKDSEMVKDVEELLNLETGNPQPPAGK